LDVPPGALAADVSISIAPVAGADAPAGALSGAYDLLPDGTTFAVPASLTMHFTPGAIVGAAPDALEIGWVAGGGWQPTPGSIIDVGAGTVSAPTTHLSRWAIVPAATSPCVCHPADWSACCTQHGGAFAVAGQVCTCSQYQGDFDGFLSCYTSRIGGERVSNFCSGCLRRCCTSNGGAVNRACDCELDAPSCGGSSPPGAAVAVMACSRGCFGSPDVATVCATPSGPGVCVPPAGDASADDASDEGGTGSEGGDDAADDADGTGDAGGDAAHVADANGSDAADAAAEAAVACGLPPGDSAYGCGTHVAYGCSVSVVPAAGQPCYDFIGGNSAPINCCNSAGATASAGTAEVTCSSTACSSDADCELGTACQQTPQGPQCNKVCRLPQDLGPLPCCDGLVAGVGTVGCVRAAGAACNVAADCLSDHCLPASVGAATNVCTALPPGCTCQFNTECASQQCSANDTGAIGSCE
jgi:hypothetical protein